MYIYENISLNSSQNEKYFRQIYRENPNPRFMFTSFFFFKNRVLLHNVKKNMVETDRPQMTT